MVSRVLGELGAVPCTLFQPVAAGSIGPVTSNARRWSVLPGFRMLASYRVGWASHDVVAGLVLTTLLVPQGMAYAELAGLPAITGLYTSILCLLGYAVFGPSRILVLGPDSSLGPMIAATILPLLAAGGDPERAVALASMLALLVGAFMAVGGAFGLGFVADLLSRPTMIGYMNGLAITIVVGQLPKLFGFSVDANGLRAETRAFVDGVADGKTVTAALAVGVFGLAVILVLQRFLPKIPAILVAVVASILATSLFDLANHGVALVGTLPQGFPPLTLPDIKTSDIPLLIGGALGIALVALADTISTASAFAERTGQDVDGSQEMVGIGAANIAAGFFQGFPVSTSGSRTAVAEQAGAKTQVTGIVGALTIVAHAPPSSGADEEPPSAGPRGRGDRSRPVTRRTFPGRDGSGSSDARTSRSRSRPFSASPCSVCWPASRSRSHCR